MATHSIGSTADAIVLAIDPICPVTDAESSAIHTMPDNSDPAPGVIAPISSAVTSNIRNPTRRLGRLPHCPRRLPVIPGNRLFYGAIAIDQGMTAPVQVHRVRPRRDGPFAGLEFHPNNAPVGGRDGGGIRDGEPESPRHRNDAYHRGSRPRGERTTNADSSQPDKAGTKKINENFFVILFEILSSRDFEKLLCSLYFVT